MTEKEVRDRFRDQLRRLRELIDDVAAMAELKQARANLVRFYWLTPHNEE